MLKQLTRHDIQLLSTAGVGQKKIADLTGASARSIRRIKREESVTEIGAAPEGNRRRIGRPCKVAPFRDLVIELLGEDSALLSVEILRRVRLKGYTGHKSALYELIAKLRPKESTPVVRFEGLPGEFSQHDFGQVDVKFLDGPVRRIHFFASRLKFSRYVRVSVVPDQRVEPLARALVEHFAAIGGIPLLSVFDRPKTVAKKWRKDGVVTEWNPTFKDVVMELGLGVEVCWPYRANQKGSVENLVGWVKGSFFKQRRFADYEDMLQQLEQWLIEVNTLTASRATGQIPATLLAQERLRPLKVTPDQLALRYPVHVGPTGYVIFDTNAYAMPAGAMGISGTLYLYRDRVRIVASRFEATHERLHGRNKRSTLPEHRVDHLAAVSGRRGRLYMKREHLLELGPPAHRLLSELVIRREGAWHDDVDRLHALLQTHGQRKLTAAIERALENGIYGAEYVAHFIDAAPPIDNNAHTRQQEIPL